MNRIDELFARKPSGILSLYFCAGHPSPDSTADVVRAAAHAGIDLLEVGIPFSDPMADGPVIQDAATRALRGGMTLGRLLDQLAAVRAEVSLPLMLMGYLNPILHYGFEAFCRRCRDCGVDGLVIPDLPFGVYVEEFQATARRYGLSVAMFITPQTSDERIRRIDQATDGFIYMVSTAATTGARQAFDRSTTDYFRHVASLGLRNPCLAGFGISNRATLDAARQHAAGAIVGSQFVALLDSEPTPQAAVEALLRKLRE